MLEVKYVVFPYFAISVQLMATVAVVVESAVFTETWLMHCSPTIVTHSSFVI